jgi:hypothetical protein
MMKRGGNALGSMLSSVSPEQTAVLVSLFAITLAEGLTADEAASLGSFIAAVGDTVVAIGAQRLILEAQLAGSAD